MTAQMYAKRALRGGALLALAAGSIIGWMAPAGAVTRTEKTFGKWIVACSESDAGQRRCSMSQAAAAPAGQKRPPLVLNLNGDKSKQTLVALVPIGVSLVEGVTLNFGSPATPTGLPYVACAPRTCIARVALDAKLLDALNKNAKGVVNYVMANKKLVQVNVDFAAFKDAYSYWLAQLTS